MNIVSEGTIFVRAKQDRPGQISKTIIVPCFKKNRKVNPKRAVEVYMKRTAEIQNSTENKLFLLFLQPHKSVFKKTISSKTMSAVKQAYIHVDWIKTMPSRLYTWFFIELT